MEKQEYYYKIVRRDYKTQSYTSLCATSLGRLAVTYTPGTWVTAKVGGLLVFKTRAWAQVFASGELNSHVYRCLVETELPLPRFRIALLKDTRKNAKACRELWKTDAAATPSNEAWDQFTGNLRTWPAETCVFKSIKLLDEIK